MEDLESQKEEVEFEPRHFKDDGRRANKSLTQQERKDEIGLFLEAPPLPAKGKGWSSGSTMEVPPGSPPWEHGNSCEQDESQDCIGEATRIIELLQSSSAWM